MSRSVHLALLLAGAATLGGCTTLCAKSSGELAKAAEAPWHTTCSVGARSPPAPAIHSHVPCARC